jgi:hypothetical protein
VGGCSTWFCASYNAGINYGQCNPTFEDTGVQPNEGYFWFEGYKLINPTLSVSKSATPSTLKVGAVGQYYSINIGVSNGPTTAAISINDNLPSGFTTSGAITATGGTISGCPAAGATSLAGCTLSANTNGPISITVPVNISSDAASSVTNYAYAYGGGDPNCSGGCAASTTNPVTRNDSTLSVTKALGSSGRANAGDQFFLALRTGGVSGAAAVSVTTAGTGTAVTGTAALNPAVAGTTYTITEAASGSANLGQYSSTLTCTDSAGLQTGLPSAAAFNASTGFAVTPVAGAHISCTITNTAAQPTLTLQKTTTGDTGTFTFIGSAPNANGFSTNGSYTIATLAANTALSGTTVNLTATNVQTDITESLTSGWTLTSASCTDTNAAVSGNPTNAFGTLTGNKLTIPASNVRLGAKLLCAFTNAPALATLTVTQKAIVTAPATFNPPVKFSYTGNNGWVLQQNSSTMLNFVTKGDPQSLTALNVATTLSVAVPTTEAGWKIASIRCTDTNAAVSGNPSPPTLLVSTSTSSVTIPANYVVANAALQCAVIGSRMQ